MIYRKHPIRCLERQAFDTPRMYTLSPSKSIKGSNYGEFLKDKNVLLCTQLYKYAPNLESLLTQQYVCVMWTLWSDNTCVFTRFHSVKNANTQLIWSSDKLLLWDKILCLVETCIQFIQTFQSLGLYLKFGLYRGQNSVLFMVWFRHVSFLQMIKK